MNEFKALADLVIGEDWPTCSCGHTADHHYEVVAGELIEVAVSIEGFHEIRLNGVVVLAFGVAKHGGTMRRVPAGQGIMVNGR